MDNLIFFLPLLLPIIFFVIILCVIFGVRKKRKNPVTMQEFAKNPFGNLFGVAFDAIAQGSRLDTAFQTVISNPCQATAENLLNELNSVSDVFRFGMSGNNSTNTALWKNTFNSYIIPSKNISTTTKSQIREALIRLSVDHLYEVKEILDTDVIGREGEENVWFTLTQLASRGTYNIFANVRIPYQSINQHSQEIDAIIVCPKGVFLIEVKSVARRNEAIKFYDISNPSQQICLHEEAFTQNFGYIPKKSLLVVSYPKNERAKIDMSTFPVNSVFDSLTVDDLYQYIITLDGEDVLDEATIDFVCKKLMSGGNFVVGKTNLQTVGSANQTVQTASPTPQSTPTLNFCPNCGNKLTENTPFCPNCGNKL